MAGINDTSIGVRVRPPGSYWPVGPDNELGYTRALPPYSGQFVKLIRRQEDSIGNNPDTVYRDASGNLLPPTDADAPQRFARRIPPETTGGAFAVED